MADLVRYERGETVSTLALDDGKVNALSPAMFASLNAALDRAQADGTAVLLTGRGKVFSGGFDLAVFRQGAAAVDMLTAGACMAERLLSFPAPVVAAVNGHAIAMGLFLVLCADLRIGVSNGAARMQANEVQIGMTVPRFATEVCRQRLAPADFSRALVTAAPYAPEEALRAGMLDALLPADGFLRACHEQAAALAELNREHHAASKLRVRAIALAALRRAIEEDAADWRARLGPGAGGDRAPPQGRR